MYQQQRQQQPTTCSPRSKLDYRAIGELDLIDMMIQGPAPKKHDFGTHTWKGSDKRHMHNYNDLSRSKESDGYTIPISMNNPTYKLSKQAIATRSHFSVHMYEIK